LSQQDDYPNVAQLGRLNADLTRSLQRCSGMVRDYRSRLIAANSNDAPFMAYGEAGNDRRRDEDGERTG
jgi:hypothetical protein